MKITVQSVRSVTPDGPLMAVFASAVGIGVGRLKSSPECTRIGKGQDAEFTLDLLVRFGENAKYSNDPDPAINRIGENRVTFRGSIESVDEGGIVYLRLAADCLTMIEMEGEIPEVGRSLEIDCEAKDLQVFLLG